MENSFTEWRNSSRNQEKDDTIIICDSDEDIAVKISKMVDKQIIIDDSSSDDDADVPKNTKRWVFYTTVSFVEVEIPMT